MNRKPLVLWQTAMQAAKVTREYLALIGRKGGSACGPCKRRGDSEFYRQLALKRAAKQRTKGS